MVRFMGYVAAALVMLYELFILLQAWYAIQD